MTRKDYERIAEALNARYETIVGDVGTDSLPGMYLDGFEDAVQAICYALEQDNPRFHGPRFIAAVEGREWTRKHTKWTTPNPTNPIA